MKANIFTTILISACFIKAGAQTCASVNTTLTLNLNNVITMQEAYNSYSGTFSTANNYHYGVQLDGVGQPGGPLWGVNTYTVQSNRFYNVSLQANPTISYTPLAGISNYGSDNTNMPITVLSFQLTNFSNTGGSAPAGVGSGHWTQFTGTPQAVLNNCTNGTARSFGLSFLAQPGWAYAGGVYTTSATITATQE